MFIHCLMRSFAVRWAALIAADAIIERFGSSG